jgi:hypothetical protein
MAAREFSRRDFVQMSVASAFGIASCPWLPRLAAAAGKKPAKACIVLWMSGGPSQTDTWDLKPGHKNGGPSKETATAVPGLRFSEHLTKLAAAAKDLGIIRSTAGPHSCYTPGNCRARLWRTQRSGRCSPRNSATRITTCRATSRSLLVG